MPALSISLFYSVLLLTNVWIVSIVNDIKHINAINDQNGLFEFH